MPKKKKIGYQPIDSAYTKDIDAWFIIVLIIFFFPIGVWLMWTRTSWARWIKITVTAAIAALFLSKFIATAVQSGGAVKSSETTEVVCAVEGIAL